MVTRITGFTSGLDIDSLVKDLMKAKRAPLDKLTQQKTTLEWQREQYRDLNIKMIDLRNNKLFNYGLEGSLNAKQVSVSGNSSAVSAKASSSAVTGAMTIEVTELGVNASVASKTGVGQVDKTKTLAELKTAGVLDYTLDSGKVNITINNKTIQLDENTDTLNSMVAKINANKEMNVTAYIDAASGKLSLTSKTMEATTITWDSSTGSLLKKFLPSTLPADVDTRSGSTAKVVINGIAVERNSNTFTEDGVEITLNAKSNGAVSNLSIKSNTDSIVDSLKSFIKDYNDLLESVNNKLNEERYRTYAPLTTAQKEEMKDDEIKLWEEKARSGLLRRDPTLTTMVDNLRLSMMTSVTIDGKSVNLASFGIETGDWQQRGKLVIKDEAKLRAAIEADPNAFEKLFIQQTKETDPAKKTSATNPDSGLFNRLSNVLMTGIESLSSKAGTSKVSTSKDAAFLESSLISEQLRTLSTRISDFNVRMDRWETSYYKQFTAMEKAMNRYQAQSGLFS
ncbi:flagellar filament capping protein FliD [Cohnella sp. LGH]|uniref:flagellar filament capping protein FliD n=1 Tax=Cohnella sp. LGH TaxID=1619153 RepID=UPI001ADD1A7E|nr:flagellar filament capping protein FliD [Cohnella sp. LGH]QTH42289.1 flagellar filament capping protein FliD [Cohnella sp. LGH]